MTKTEPMQTSKALINFQNLEISLSVMSALDNRIRKEIIVFLLNNNDVIVGEIYKSLGITQSICSQNLKILRDAGLVSSVKQGRKVLYQVNESYLSKIMELVNEFDQ